jgi:hypothetical protein
MRKRGSREAVRDHGMFGDVDHTSGRLRNFFSAPAFFLLERIAPRLRV